MNNKYNKIAKKVGDGNYGHYGHPTAIVGKEKINFHEMRSRETIVGDKKILRGLKRVGVMGVMFAAVFLAVWVVMPVNGAGAAFSCDSNDGTTCTVSSPQTRGVDYPVLSLSGANRRSASQIYF